ncbi:MAG: hypothetical protein GEV05_24440 [Betaproteobacteria bacterium]|nr:hypothetical protein [Betaproteobacteria bacterium]
MRGSDVMQESLFATRSVARFLPADHPLRAVRDSLKVALKGMDEVGADKAYDSADFIEACPRDRSDPACGQNTTRRESAIDARTTRHPGHEISQVVRKLIETIFGDARQHGTLRQLKQRGLDRADQVFCRGDDLRRLPTLIASSG